MLNALQKTAMQCISSTDSYRRHANKILYSTQLCCTILEVGNRIHLCQLLRM